MSGALTPAPEAFYLDVDPAPAFAVLDRPSGGGEGALGVLFCPPLGWEDVSSHRPRRAWARSLAEAGHPALRLDLPGTGDSAGGPGDPELVARWVAAVAAAAGWLRTEGRCARVAAVGLGAGGLVTAQAAACAPIDDLVLWGVRARGRAHLRELRAFARLELWRAGAQPSALPEGALDVAGFLLAPDTTAALGAIDLTTLELGEAAGRRALLLGRDGVAPDPDLRAALEAQGVAVTTSPGHGFGVLHAEPQEARPPWPAIAEVGAWLAAAPGPSRLAAGEPPATTPSLSLGAVRETPVALGARGPRLFGVLAEPAGAEPDQGPAAVLLNAGAIRRIGPNRMWVELARRWAARGVTTLRVDLEGIGDAEGDAERFSDLGELYVPAASAQAAGAVAALAARGHGPLFAVGLCSGAYWAFHAALADERVAGAFLVNPRVLFWDPRVEVARAGRKPAKVLTSGASWRRALRGRVSPRSLARFAVRTVTDLRAARRGRTGERDLRARLASETEDAFAALARRGQHAVLVFSGDEPLHEELARDGLLPSPGRWPGVELRDAPGNDHTLRPLVVQEEVHAILDRALAECCATPGAGAAPRAAR